MLFSHPILCLFTSSLMSGLACAAALAQKAAVQRGVLKQPSKRCQVMEVICFSFDFSRFSLGVWGRGCVRQMLRVSVAILAQDFGPICLYRRQGCRAECSWPNDHSVMDVIHYISRSFALESWRWCAMLCSPDNDTKPMQPDQVGYGILGVLSENVRGASKYLLFVIPSMIDSPFRQTGCLCD